MSPLTRYLTDPAAERPVMLADSRHLLIGDCLLAVVGGPESAPLTLRELRRIASEIAAAWNEAESLRAICLRLAERIFKQHELLARRAERKRVMNAIELIAAERKRQLTKGWTPERDDKHDLGELSQGGAAYASVASAMIRGASHEEFPIEMMRAEGDWPFEDHWNPKPDILTNLVKGAAMIAAEIDRLLRKSK